MNRNFSKIIVFCLLSGVILPGIPLVAQTNNEQAIILRGNASQNVLVLDLKDAKDIERLITEDEGNKEVTEGRTFAKINSFKVVGKRDLSLDNLNRGLNLSRGIQEPLETGVAWLKNNQNADGSWGNGIIETSAVLDLFSFLKEQGYEYQKAMDWLNLTYPENNDYLAEKVISLSRANQDIDYLSEFLFSQINGQDKGFGYQKEYQSDIITTSKILKALTYSNYTDSGTNPNYTLESILSYLLLSQNPDGGFAKTRGNTSSIWVSSLALESLKPYQAYSLGAMLIKDKIDLGLNYLKNSQKTDGSWGDIQLTSLAYNTLLSYQEYPIYNQEALKYILSSQGVNGDFNHNIYLTAKSLKAIAKPDIAVLDITNTSNTIPNEPTSIQIIVSNTGYYETEPVNFKLEPHHFHLFINNKEMQLEYSPESPERIILSPDSQLVINIILTNLSYGSHNIEFKIDYDNVEFNKDNNQKNKDLFFDNPSYTGPKPPSWLGARTIVNPNSINLTWLFSEDPNTNKYYLFLGTSPNVYSQYFEIPGQYNSVNLSGFPNDITFYFSAASVAINNIRGDYSMETYGKAYNNPDNYTGTIPLLLKDNNNELLYYVYLDFLGVATVNTENINPAYITTYPGFYRILAFKSGYKDTARTAEIKPNQTGELVEFIMNIIDDGLSPSPIQNLQAQAGDKQIILSWDTFKNTSGDFKQFNIYRSFNEINNVSKLSPINTITDVNANQYTDNTITNSIDYYYAITAEDLSGNENKDVNGIGPVRANSSPILSNINAYQDNTGQVQIKYDLEDKEQSNIMIELEYWNNNWIGTSSVIGRGMQNTGKDKIIIWNPKLDYPDYDGNTKIKITANDIQDVNNLSSLENQEFIIDTENPTDLSIKVETRDNLIVDLSIFASGGSSGMSEIRFSNDVNFDGIADNWSEWEAYTVLKENFVLTENTAIWPYNEKIIIEFKDRAANRASLSKEICQNECPNAGQTQCTNFWCNGADTNKDGTVGPADLSLLASQWRNSCETQGDNAYCNGADTNKDGTVGPADLSLLASQWRNSCSAVDGTHKQTCGNYDYDECLEWSSPQSCQGDTSCGYGVCANNERPNWYCDGDTGNAAYTCRLSSSCSF